METRQQFTHAPFCCLHQSLTPPSPHRAPRTLCKTKLPRPLYAYLTHSRASIAHFSHLGECSIDTLLSPPDCLAAILASNGARDPLTDAPEAAALRLSSLRPRSSSFIPDRQVTGTGVVMVVCTFVMPPLLLLLK
ncbi:hypothetical protein E2C01_040823 [Portunus trituberculatus]|uniref:Uncharacterized protein n=1 Tax=Portunus trituberculatus TaxID=210409 RepID=A0A5B7FQ93_PORTR|nr:hypothetical protein [Portunus trituberculatus]